ncbi:MAG: NUDIX hydrolase [Saccharofermentanales bacterium]|jgi:ADP-ribose pyrophosphatase|nr:NUDIX hydrolase [Eubacteriales bacterium]MDD3610994.1 NUDIX hydrolase [Eubacteriales bacterium]HHU04226.1 NUDIX hydrolase [Fastidiosipila sp.]
MDQDQIKDKPQIRKPEVFAQVPEEAIAPFEHSEPLKLQRKHPILHEETLSSDLRFIGRVFTVETFDVQLPDGRKSKREIVHHPGGACVLALDENQDLYLVKQYRVGAQAPLREIPAGKLEGEENPLLCARRELLEEVGLIADSWQLLTQFYPSPGYTDELISVYLATNLTKGKQQLDDGEFLTVEKIALDTAIAEVESGQISDGKTIIAILKTAYLRAKGEL